MTQTQLCLLLKKEREERFQSQSQQRPHARTFQCSSRYPREEVPPKKEKRGVCTVDFTVK